MREKVLILAAGEGSRLQPITDDIPKALVPVDGRALIDWQLHALEAAGYPEESVLVVGGHRASAFSTRDVVPDSRLMVFEEYRTVNNIGTLAYALERTEPPVLVVNSDTLFSSRHLSLFEGSDRESELLYDPTTPPRQEAMKIAHDGARLTRIAKTLDAGEAHGEYIGLARIGTSAYADLLEACRRISRTHPDAWYEQAIDEICHASRFVCRSIGQLPWIEIDDHDDLAAAERIAAELEGAP